MDILQNPISSSRAYYDERETEYFNYQFVKAFLSNLFFANISEPRIKVLRIVARDGDDSFRLKPLTVSSSTGADTSSVVDDNIEATVMYRGAYYDIVVNKFHQPYTDRYKFLIGALGLSDNATDPQQMVDFVIERACSHSTFRNQYLLVKPTRDDKLTSIELVPQRLDVTTLSDIFVPDETMVALRLFVDCIRSFDRIHQPLRYLLCGKPGTAKTKIIRAIANETKSLATFIFSNGADNRIDAIFDFAECFSPAVVCIDDADLMVGNRQDYSERKALGRFLQRMDGFIGSSVFVLATTNDKNLVDIAASRAGRFDRVLDLTAIGAGHYLQLIRSKTKSDALVNLFDDQVLAMLRQKSVSGAFLANLLKQLQIMQELGETTITTELVSNMINRLNSGFNGRSGGSEKSVGFRG